MLKDELKNLTKDELDDVIVNFINDMEIEGHKFMQLYNVSDDKNYNIDKYAYAICLLTQISKFKKMISFKTPNLT